MKKIFTLISAGVVLAIILVGFYLFANGGHATIIEAIEEMRGENHVEYVIHEDHFANGAFFYYLKNMSEGSPIIYADYVKKTVRGKWKSVYGGSHSTSHLSLVEAYDGNGIPISYQYLPVSEERQYQIPFPVILGAIADSAVQRIVVKDYATGLERQAKIVTVNDLFRFYYVYLTVSQGQKFDITAYDNRNKVLYEESIDGQSGFSSRSGTSPSPSSSTPVPQPLSQNQQVAHSLLEAASSNRLDVIENIVEESYKEEMDELLKYVLTYWHQYLYKNEEDLHLVSLLLEKGADPNGTDDDGTPLLFIARTADMLKVLAEDERADLNARTPHGSTLLLAAIGSYNSEKVDYLLQRGVDPNEDTYSSEESSYPNQYNDWSPLHLAIAFSDYEEWMMPIVESLLDHKDIDLTKVDEENRTPYELAQQLEKNAALELFENKGLVNP